MEHILLDLHLQLLDGSLISCVLFSSVCFVVVCFFVQQVEVHQ